MLTWPPPFAPRASFFAESVAALAKGAQAAHSSALGFCFAAAVMIVLPAAHAFAARPIPTDPDWPCEAVKVETLDLAQVWSGPPVDVPASAWQDDEVVAALVRDISPRRVPLDEAKAKIAAFAQQAGPNRQGRLLKLMAGLFSVLDDERSTVIAGLDRFGARQKELAAALRDDNDKLRELQSDARADPGQVNQMVQKVIWEAELFQDRRQALRYVCDVPSKIEQRLYALAQVIMQQLQ
ncbi:MAG: hypothetical protein JO110_19610 [Acetobacteraceae bacterium]|nr:hypothetical protein [Acetobacteraceae bacterium]